MLQVLPPVFTLVYLSDIENTILCLRCVCLHFYTITEVSNTTRLIFVRPGGARRLSHSIVEHEFVEIMTEVYTGFVQMITYRTIGDTESACDIFFCATLPEYAFDYIALLTW